MKKYFYFLFFIFILYTYLVLEKRKVIEDVIEKCDSVEIGDNFDVPEFHKIRANKVELRVYNRFFFFGHASCELQMSKNRLVIRKIYRNKNYLPFENDIFNKYDNEIITDGQ